MDKEALRQIQHDLEFLKQERSEWETQWQDIVSYILPFRGKFLSRGDQPNQDVNRMEKIVDSTASRALRILSAGMQSGLTSPSRPWFRLGLFDQDLEQYHPVKAWLGEVERIMRRVFSYSSFYNAVHTTYSELAGFGSNALYVEPSEDTQIAFRPLTIGEFYFGQDAAGRIDALYRWFWTPVRAAAQRWGEDALSGTAKGLLRKAPYKQIQIVHVVKPSDEGSKTRLPYQSIYYEVGAPDGQTLSESGYNEFPYMCPRWETNGSEPYGRGPGDLVLPDVKMLQEMNKDRLRATKKVNDPPLRVPSSFKGRLKSIPGGINYVDSQANEAVGPLYEIKPDIPAVNLSIEDVRAAIRDGFYTDLFVMLAQTDKNMTATEVAERHEEKLLVLGPVVERLQSEFLGPLIDRVFNILVRDNMLPRPPKEMEGAEINIEYISLLAQAQKMVGTQAVESVAGFAGKAVQFDPTVLDRVDSDEMIKQYADMVGAPTDILRSDEAVQQLRQQRQQQQQAAAMSEQMDNVAQSAKTLSETQTDRQNALTQMLGLTRG